MVICLVFRIKVWFGLKEEAEGHTIQVAGAVPPAAVGVAAVHLLRFVVAVVHRAGRAIPLHAEDLYSGSNRWEDGVVDHAALTSCMTT